MTKNSLLSPSAALLNVSSLIGTRSNRSIPFQIVVSGMQNWRNWSLTLVCLSLLVISSPVLADEGSLESMWMDQPAPPTGREDDPSAVASVSPPVGASSTVAPMCSIEEFKASQFVARGAWPGVGPFNGGSGGELSDAARNNLKLDLSGNQITRAELGLSKAGSDGKDFLDIEMTSDFLLEALGAKPARIAEFNSDLEKNRDRVMSGKNAHSFTAGRYQVTIDRTGRDASYGSLIVVNSLDANKAAIKAHSVKPETTKVASLPPVIPTKTAAPSVVKKPTPPPTAVINPSIDPRRDEFANVIKSWQNLKKTVVRKRDTAALAEVLSGRALARQTDAVKWLVTNKKFYDMSPRGVVVDKYQEQVPGKKYLVLAQVREFSKFIDEASGQVLKEVDDKYTVNYTIEKVGDKWMITDSALLATGQQPKAPPKPSR